VQLLLRVLVGDVKEQHDGGVKSVFCFRFDGDS